MSRGRMENFNLKARDELRFSVAHDNQDGVRVRLTSGKAEMWGTELKAVESVYCFGSGSSVVIFTYHGCTLEVTGSPDSLQIAPNECMNFYLNCHLAMKNRRSERQEKMCEDLAVPGGTVIAVVGRANTGKSSVCKILTNYSARMGRNPLYVDLDVNQGQITVPGIISASQVEIPLDPVDGFGERNPVAFHFGHTCPYDNVRLYENILRKMADACQLRFSRGIKEKNKIIPDTLIKFPTLLPKHELDLVKLMADLFEVKVVLVLGEQELVNDLKAKLEGITVISTPTSTGVVHKTFSMRTRKHDLSIKRYFYGTRDWPLYPSSFQIKWSKLKLYRIQEDSLSADRFSLAALIPGPDMVHHLLSVSNAQTLDEVKEKGVMGFLLITQVDVSKETIGILCPNAQFPYHKILLLSDLCLTDFSSFGMPINSLVK